MDGTPECIPSRAPGQQFFTGFFCSRPALGNRTNLPWQPSRYQIDRCLDLVESFAWPRLCGDLAGLARLPAGEPFRLSAAIWPAANRPSGSVKTGSPFSSMPLSRRCPGLFPDRNRKRWVSFRLSALSFHWPVARPFTAWPSIFRRTQLSRIGRRHEDFKGFRRRG